MKFSDYFSATEPVKNVPSHRVLALLRGRKEGILRLAVVLPDEDRRPGPDGARTSHRGARRHRATGPSGRRMAGRHGALDVEGRSFAHLETESRSACASSPNRSDPRVRPQPERPAAGRAGRPAHDDGPRSRACAPASRSPSSTAPARWSTPRSSIRTSRARTGKVRCARWRRSPQAWRAADLDRQRHRLARDRQRSPAI